MAAEDFAAFVERRLNQPPGPAHFETTEARFLLAAEEVLIDILLAAVPPDQMHLVLNHIEPDALRGDPDAKRIMDLFHHVMATNVTEGLTTLADEVTASDVQGYFQSGRQAVMLLLGAADVSRISQVDAVLTIQAGRGNKTAMGVKVILDAATADLIRHVERVVQATSGGGSGRPSAEAPQPHKAQESDNLAASSQATGLARSAAAGARLHASARVEIINYTQSFVFNPPVKIYWNGREVGSVENEGRFSFEIHGDGEVRFKCNLKSVTLPIKVSDVRPIYLGWDRTRGCLIASRDVNAIPGRRW